MNPFGYNLALCDMGGSYRASQPSTHLSYVGLQVQTGGMLSVPWLCGLLQEAQVREAEGEVCLKVLTD